MNDSNRYEFSYSASEQDEIKRIRDKYAPKQVDSEQAKLAELRRLDASVGRKGMTVSLIVGILGSLIMGIGMCCCLVWSETLFIPGIIVGVVGMVGVALAYPLYVRITKQERERIAPEIMRLTDELMK